MLELTRKKLYELANEAEAVSCGLDLDNEISEEDKQELREKLRALREAVRRVTSGETAALNKFSQLNPADQEDVLRRMRE